MFLYDLLIIHIPNKQHRNLCKDCKEWAQCPKQTNSTEQSTLIKLGRIIFV